MLPDVGMVKVYPERMLTGLLHCHGIHLLVPGLFPPVGFSMQLPVASETHSTMPTSLFLWETFLLPLLYCPCHYCDDISQTWHSMHVQYMYAYEHRALCNLASQLGTTFLHVTHCKLWKSINHSASLLSIKGCTHTNINQDLPWVWPQLARSWSSHHRASLPSIKGHTPISTTQDTPWPSPARPAAIEGPGQVIHLSKGEALHTCFCGRRSGTESLRPTSCWGTWPSVDCSQAVWHSMESFAFTSSQIPHA